MREGLERIGAETNINFFFGTAIHFAMEDYFGYNKFGDPRRAYKAYYAAFKEDDLPDMATDFYDLGLAMLTYFLEWYPQHNQEMQFETLWLDEQNQPVKVSKEQIHSGNIPEGVRPMIEESFLFDLGYRVIINAETGKIIRKYDEKADVLYYTPTVYVPDTWVKVEADDVTVGEGSDTYYIEIEADLNGFDLTGSGLSTAGHQAIRIVPICYHGTMDRMVIDRYGRWWILDYKTAKSADTNKLDTDDQVTTYMWAAEQHLQHEIYGFIYLQLTKDVAKEPKILKDGTLSVDKKQKTTRKLFKNALEEMYGSVAAAPAKYIDMLNCLAAQEEPEGDRFIRWDFIQRNAAQKTATYRNIMAETLQMLDVDSYLYPNPTRDCGWDCPYRTICIEQDKGEPVEHLINLEFQRRSDTLEHNDDAWRKNIIWPDTPQEAALLDDVSLKPSNIFNIELPEKYLSLRDESDLT